MDFYKLTLHSVPRIRFAHRYEAEYYDMHFERAEQMLEISYIEKGDCCKKTESGRQIDLPAHCVCIEPYQESFWNKSEAPRHCHVTFALCADFEIAPFSDSDFSDLLQKPESDHSAWTVVFPDKIEDAKTADAIELRIKQIIVHHRNNTPDKQLFALSLVLQILSLMTEYSLNQILRTNEERRSYSDIQYAAKASEYIAAHLQERLTVSEIASFANLSEGHLSRIFKSVTGYSLIQYINYRKILLVKQLFAAKKLSVSDAAQQIGMADEKYLCRLFKKECGISITEYKRLLKTTSDS